MLASVLTASEVKLRAKLRGSTGFALYFRGIIFF
jgi:hypothetical protein